jgi:hypothetical protein
LGVVYDLMTVTAPGDGVEHLRGCPSCVDALKWGHGTIAGWNAQAGDAWNRLNTMLKRELGGVPFDYFKAAEPQTRGALHYHSIMRWEGPRPTRKRLCELAKRAGFGCEFGFDYRPAESAAGVLAYVLKYVTKAVDERHAVKWSKVKRTHRLRPSAPRELYRGGPHPRGEFVGQAVDVGTGELYASDLAGGRLAAPRVVVSTVPRYRAWSKSDGWTPVIGVDEGGRPVRESMATIAARLAAIISVRVEAKRQGQAVAPDARGEAWEGVPSDPDDLDFELWAAELAVREALLDSRFPEPEWSVQDRENRPPPETWRKR